MTHRRLLGFTSLELVVGMAIMSVVTLVLLIVSINGTAAFTSINFGQSRTAAFLETFNRVDSYVRPSIDFPAQYPPSGSPEFTSDADTLIIKLYSLNEQSVDCNYFDYLIYDRQGGQLHEIVKADANSSRQTYDRIVSSDITALAFSSSPQADAARRIVMTMDITEKALGREQSITHTQTMVSRNHYD